MLRRNFYVIFFFMLCTLVLIVINFFALMRLIPYIITLPLLFLSIYLTLFSFTYRKMYRGRRNY